MRAAEGSHLLWTLLRMCGMLRMQLQGGGFDMRILPAFFASGEDFLRDYRAAAPELDGPAMLSRTRGEYTVGEDVMIEVDLPGLPNRVRLVGQIAGPGPG